MFKNLTVTALRNIWRNKFYMSINILGLAIGMAVCLVIMLFVQYELSFEKNIPDMDRIYRVLTVDKALGTHHQRVGITMPALGPSLPETFPEVENAMRLSGGQPMLLSVDDQPGINVENVRASDPNFFEFFPYPLLAGDSATALATPFTIVLTESLASQLFGEESALGRTVRTGGGFELKVTGILQDLAETTHLQFDALGSLLTVANLARANRPPEVDTPIWLDRWQLVAMPTYLKLATGATAAGMDERLTQHIHDHSVGENFEITLQPLAEVHLHSADVIFDSIPNKGDYTTVLTFAGIALLILIIATVNYLNLATARSAQRAREVGIRKVVGSRRSQLIVQFLGESILVTFIALILSLPLTEAILPWLNSLVDTNIQLDLSTNGLFWLFLGGILITVGALSGLYPAFVLAGFRPVTVLRGSFKSGQKGVALRRGLVVFQFALSIALIGATLIIQQQIGYIRSKDLGYDRQQIVFFDMVDPTMGANIELFQQELDNHSSVVSSGTGWNIPGRTFGRTTIRPEGATDEDIWVWSQLTVSPEYIETLAMNFVQGRNFDRAMATDTTDAVLINETAVHMLGWDDPLNRRLYFGPNDSLGVQVIGVLGDFHFAGLHQNIEPVVVFPAITNPGSLLVVRLEKGGIKESMAMIESAWDTHFPGYPFTYSFLDDTYNNLYQQDLNTGKLVNVFSLLAIFIACLGLFGLSSHATSQRTKEIGVRKVIGATALKIIRLLVADFIKWILLANLVAWPLAWWAADRWLANFAYRIDIGILPMIIASLGALAVALATITAQTWRTASINPARALRYE